VQLAGGELPNELRHSRAAYGDALRNRDFQRDGEHVVLVRLLFDQLACQTIAPGYLLRHKHVRPKYRQVAGAAASLVNHRRVG
jgi:hypothetical protein